MTQGFVLVVSVTTESVLRMMLSGQWRAGVISAFMNWSAIEAIEDGQKRAHRAIGLNALL